MFARFSGMAAKGQTSAGQMPKLRSMLISTPKHCAMTVLPSTAGHGHAGRTGRLDSPAPTVRARDGDSAPHLGLNFLSVSYTHLTLPTTPYV